MKYVCDLNNYIYYLPHGREFLDVPQSQAAITAGRSQVLVVGTPRDGTYAGCVIFELSQLRSCGQVEDANLCLLASGGQHFPIRAEGQLSDCLPAISKNAHKLSAGGTP